MNVRLMCNRQTKKFLNVAYLLINQSINTSVAKSIEEFFSIVYLLVSLISNVSFGLLSESYFRKYTIIRRTV